jgi:hypothetical protein
MMPGANTNRDTNRTTWLSHADKSIAEESGRRAVSPAARAAVALGPCPADENGLSMLLPGLAVWADHLLRYLPGGGEEL